MSRLLTSGLTDGGTAGLIWGFIIVTAGFALVFASIAEMASMYVLSPLSIYALKERQSILISD